MDFYYLEETLAMADLQSALRSVQPLIQGAPIPPSPNIALIPYSPQPTADFDHPSEFTAQYDANPGNKRQPFYMKDGKMNPDRRQRIGKVTSQGPAGQQEYTSVKTSVGPNVIDVPLTMEQSRMVADHQIEIMKMTARREHWASIQAAAATGFSIIAAAVLLTAAVRASSEAE